MLNQTSGDPGSSTDGPHTAELTAGQYVLEDEFALGTHGSCLEVAILDSGAVAVRDGKTPAISPILVFADTEWRSFVDGIKAGEFG